ncbi:MAG TPA: hypothetical protein VEN79_13695 [Terriglobia bacterium]|nr:hypothetical protein [Terriglobia bacterium]
MDFWEEFEPNQPIIEDFCSRTLAAIPSEFGRLIHIALLRDMNSGKYSHEGLATLYSEAGVDVALRFCHEQEFQKVLEMPLRHLELDLRECFSAMDVDAEQLASKWLELELYRMLVPFGLPECLRDLFCANVRALLEAVVDDAVMVPSGA